MRYIQQFKIHFLTLAAVFLISACGDVENFVQRQVSLSTLGLQGDFRISDVFPFYNGQTPAENVNVNYIQATFTEPFNEASLQNSFRVTESYFSGNTLVSNDLTADTLLTGGGNVAIFTITPGGSNVLRPNARYQLTILQSAVSASTGSNLKFLSTIGMFTGSSFSNTSNPFGGNNDPNNPPSVAFINYYEVCGQPYLFVHFTESLARAPLAQVKTGIIGTLFNSGDPTVSMWPAISGRMDVFGVHINGGGALSGHKIKIFNQEVVDLDGNIMEEPNGYYQSGTLNKLISPC